MPLHLAIDEILQADLLTARSALDGAREAISSNQVPNEEDRLMYEAAIRRYATAVRRFSLWVADGKAPPDLR